HIGGSKGQVADGHVGAARRGGHRRAGHAVQVAVDARVSVHAGKRARRNGEDADGEQRAGRHAETAASCSKRAEHDRGAPWWAWWGGPRPRKLVQFGEWT